MKLEGYPKDFLIDLYRRMVLIREFDLRAVTARQQGLIPGFIHPSEGQEAVAVGVCAALNSDDVIVSNHRGHAHHIAKGGDVRTAMAELAGRETGDCHGRGGSLHVANFRIGNIGANGIVGGGIPIAVGAALAFQYGGEARVAVAFFGDGASNQGTFHEACNLASLWKLPVVFVCENNHYGEGTAQARHMAIERIANRAQAYGMPGVHVDGNDVLAVFEASKVAVERARSGLGPTLIEAETDRLCGAYEGDPQYYRSKESVEILRQKCPIARLRHALLESHISTEDEITVYHLDAKTKIDEAVDFAGKSPLPDPKQVNRWVYVDSHQGKVF